ncbi:MAG TPA: lysophospholipid acyltransferase family protein [Kofleriaceae bacterium]|nr:lysophospholipid acyltransferase family protein [Kofleriaceae bacterium]
MGYALSFRTLRELARIAAPTVAEALVGRGDRATHDHRLHAFGARFIRLAHIELEVTGAAHIPLDRAYVYMSNHQSHTDIPVLYATVPSSTLRMVAKTELFRIPGLGRAMRASDFIEVDRKDHARALASLERAGDLIADGVSVWIAPEGTRSVTGELGPFKKGGFHLACDTGTPIVPVSIQGTLAILPPGGGRIEPGHRVRVAFGAPIATAGRAIPEVMAEVRAFLEAGS